MKLTKKDQKRVDELKAKFDYVKKPTYLEARCLLWAHFQGEGWQVSDPSLKVPWVRRSDGVTFFFRAQSVYYGWKKPEYSLYLDYRKLVYAALALEFSNWPNGF